MKKLGLWLMSVLLVACLAFTALACNQTDSGDKDVIALDKTEISLEVYSEYTLTATTNVTGEITWSTSDATVATVNGGKVSALKVGSATITAKVGDVSATCQVTVTALSVAPVMTVSDEELQLVVGDDPYEVTVSVTYKSEEQDCDFTWESADPSIATVEDGAITAVSVGETTITVSTVCLGETLTKEISVWVNPDEFIALDKGVMDLKVAEINLGDKASDTFIASAFLNGNANDTQTILFRSNDENVATVTAEGNVATVTAVGVGSTTIDAYYQSEYGEIVSSIEVTVSRSQVALSQELSTPYAGADTTLDLSALELQGEIEGVYFNGARIDVDGNKLSDSFVETNKDNYVEIEIRTSEVSYTAQLIITVPFVAEVSQGDGRTAMPIFAGDETTLGFEEGTTVYELVTTAATGWDKRMITSVGKGKDYVKFDVIFSADVGHFTMWPANDTATLGSYMVMGQSSSTTDADPDRKILVLNEKGKTVGTFKANTIYTVYFFLNRGENNVQFGLFSDLTAYVANIDCFVGDVNEKEPDPISQGEERDTMPTFAGDETTLGFEEGTTVYEIVGSQNDNDVKLVAMVDSASNDYAKLDFVLTADASEIALWITGTNTHFGYYSIKPTEFSTDGLGDSSRDIFVTDKDGNDVTAFTANTVYTLYIGLDGREATIQISTFATLTMYVANFGYVGSADLPTDHVPPTVPQGKEISILFIGNSFSDDTEAYIVDMLLELGYTTIHVGNMYIGSCTIETHYENILNNVSDYDFRMRSHNGSKYTEYAPVSVGGQKRTLEFAIGYKDWDIISLQQGSALSGKADSYEYLDELKAEVQNRATNPDVELVFNMTWAYQADSTHPNFPDYNSDQMTMYNAIVNAVQAVVDFTVVPNGTAIQNARTSFIGDNLTLDGHHLSLSIGRYIAGLTFVAKVTGEDISNFAYAPNSISESQRLVAIESVQNAIANPYVVTESAYEKDPYEIPANSLIQSYGTTGSVTVYNGDEVALGFAQGSDVYRYVGVNEASDKVIIKANGDYDFVQVQFVIASGDGYFFMHGRKDGVFHMGGTSYCIDPSWIRLLDGNNSASDRRIEVLDAEGNNVNTPMSTNTLYTLRVFTKVGELDEILISKTGSTIYFANVTYGNAEDIVFTHVVKQGDSRKDLPTYQDDVTALGFEQGTTVYFVEEVQAGTENIWEGHAWENRSIISLPGDQDYVSFEFVMAHNVSNSNIFHVWGVNGSPSIGDISATTSLTGNWAVITDMDGYSITSLTAGTHYMCYIACKNLSEIQVASLDFNVWYFANIAVGIGDLPTPEASQTPDPEPQGPIQKGEASSNALSVYEGDVEALGFAPGTTVYRQQSAHSWNDGVTIAVDNNYKYADIQFIVAEGNWWFTVWVSNANGMLNGSYFVGEQIGSAKAHAVFGDGFAIHNRNVEQSSVGGNTRVQVLENGEVKLGVRSLGTLYVLRVWLEEEDVTEVRVGSDNATIYYGNVNCTDEDLLVYLRDSNNRLAEYSGDEVALGFDEGDRVQYMITETITKEWWQVSDYPDEVKDSNGRTREQLAVDIVGEAGKYVTIEFATSKDITSGGIFHVWGATKDQIFTSDGNINFNETEKGVILDRNGYPVSSISANTVYVLQLYIENTTTYKLANTIKEGMELYFAPDSIVCSSTPFAVELPGAGDLVQSAGNKSALTIYDGDEVALGFAEGTRVYQHVSSIAWDDRIAITVDATYDYVDVQFVVTSDKWFFIVWVCSGNMLEGSYSVAENYGADKAHAVFGDGFAKYSGESAGNTKIQVLDANGNVVTNTNFKTSGQVYTLRIFLKDENLTEVQLGQDNFTAYYANVTYGNLPAAPTQVEIKQGADKLAPTVAEIDVESYGFKAGTEVYVAEFTSDADETKFVMEVDPNADYLTVQFALEYAMWDTLQIWTVTGGGDAVLVAELSPDGGLTLGEGVVVIKDAEGNDVTDQMLQGVQDIGAPMVYTLYVYYDGADEVHIGSVDAGSLFYVANAKCVTEA